METLDWVMVGAYFIVMVGIGLWAKARNKDSQDFFTAGGKLPSWMSAISHHMSGYSAALFVAHAAIAYTDGFTVYIWWALTVSIGMIAGSFILAPRWPRMRQRLKVITPIEYLRVRYNRQTQQVIAWGGAGLKVFDVGAKWAAIAILLNVFTGAPLAWGVILTGGVTLIYSAVGGLWADVLTDIGQFLIQLVASIVMLVATMSMLGGVSSIWTIWERLPEGHGSAFSGEYTVQFALVYLLIHALSFNGGTWNLAQRFISSPTGSSARKASLLSASLYLVWPLVLYFPMWAAPLIIPNLENPEQSYAVLAQTLLPTGLVGLVLAGLFSATMSMAGADANAVSAVVTRDILPTLWKRKQGMNTKTELFIGRVTVTIFIALSILIALSAEQFGGVIDLIIVWFGGMIGPIAVPALLGMLPLFRRSGPGAAISSVLVGLTVFGLLQFLLVDFVNSIAPDNVTAVQVGTPVITSIVVYVLYGLLRPWQSEEADTLVDALGEDGPELVEYAATNEERHD